jgi:hypothetical protein
MHAELLMFSGLKFPMVLWATYVPPKHLNSKCAKLEVSALHAGLRHHPADPTMLRPIAPLPRSLPQLVCVFKRRAPSDERQQRHSTDAHSRLGRGLDASA